MSSFVKLGSNGQPGPTIWELDRDDEGHRTYNVGFQVFTTSPYDGPEIVLLTPGLPSPGQWYLLGNDADLWAWCLPGCSIKPRERKENVRVWDVVVKFSTKPPPHHQQRCNEQPIGDPLLEPIKESGGSSKYSEEKSFDRFGLPIVNSAWEQLRGHQVEFDNSRSSVKIEMNVPTLNLFLIDSLMDCLNDDVLWGYPARCVKLSKRDWDRKFYGQCEIYYTLTLDFEIWVREDGTSGFDRNLLDEGTKALHGQNINGVWQVTNFPNGVNPNYLNPNHFVRYKDAHGENARCILDGFGVPIHEEQQIPPGKGPDTFYMCVANAAPPAGINDPTYWQQTNQDPATAYPDWSASVQYKLGDLVQYNNGTQFAIVWKAPAPAVVPPAIGTSPGTPGAAGQAWLTVTPSGAGAYNAATTYSPGQYVSLGGQAIGTGTGPATTPGNIHVEYYPSANLLQLGIPVTL